MSFLKNLPLLGGVPGIVGSAVGAVAKAATTSSGRGTPARAQATSLPTNSPRWTGSVVPSNVPPLGSRTQAYFGISTPQVTRSAAPAPSYTPAAAQQASYLPQMASMSAIAPRTNRPVSVPRVNPYPTTPAALTAAQLASLDDMRIQGDYSLNSTLDANQRDREKAASDLSLSLRELARNYVQQRQNLSSDLGAYGLANSPAQAIGGANYLRDRQAQDRTGVTAANADVLAGLLSSDEAARNARRQVDIAIANQRATWGADLNELLPGVNY